MNNYFLILSLKNDWITLIFLGIFMLLVLAKLIYKERLDQLFSILFFKKYFLNYGKDSQLIFNGFNILLFVIQTLIITLLIYAYLQFYRPELLIEDNFAFPKIAITISILFLIRYVIGKSLSVLFDVKHSHEHLTFAKISYLFSVLILILPFLLLVFYSKKYNLLFFQLSLLILSILLIVRYLFIFRNNKKNIASQLFYFILYLCALEIAPIFIILKIFDKIVII